MYETANEKEVNFLIGRYCWIIDNFSLFLLQEHERNQEYLLNDDRYCTYIYYPQLSGIEDAKKEERVNLLIEEDVKKILERDDPDDEWRFFAVLHYQIKYINDRIISILYEGCDGPMLPGRGNPDVAMATTIDIEEERILTLEDIVADYEELNTLLLEDQFYNITLWEGTAGQYKT